MKNLIILTPLLFFLYSCKNPKHNTVASENYIELNEDLGKIVAKYIDYQPCADCIYEVYFNKIDPHYTQIVLYKGNNSLTINEYGKNGKFPVIYTNILHKKIQVYTGGEGYFKAPRESIHHVKLKKNNRSFNVWVISDSLNLRKIDTLDNAYPFLPLPVKRQFPPF